MIRVTRLDGSHLYVNEHNIQWLEALPDTVITILGGARVIVRESISEVLDLIQRQERSRPSVSVGSADDSAV